MGVEDVRSRQVRAAVSTATQLARTLSTHDWSAATLRDLQPLVSRPASELLTARGWANALRELPADLGAVLGEPPEVAAFRVIANFGVPQDLLEGVKDAPAGISFDRNLMVELLVDGFTDLGRPKQHALLALLTREFVHSQGKMDPGEAMSLLFNELGPGYMKAAQVLSEQPGLVSPLYQHYLGRAKEDGRPVPFAAVMDIVRGALAEKGRTPEQVFRSIDEKPLGVASTGQVHAAVLKDGTSVVFKVLKPGTRERMALNYRSMGRTLERFAKGLGPGDGRAGGVENFLRQMLEELAEQGELETDLRNEGQSLQQAKAENRITRENCFDVPEVHERYTTRDFLVLSRVEGQNVIEAAKQLPAAERRKLANRVFASIVRQVFLPRRSLFQRWKFHGDPHGGNIFARVVGAKAPERLTLLDGGQYPGMAVPEIVQLVPLLGAIAASQERTTRELLKALNQGKPPSPLFPELVHEAFQHSRTLADRLTRVSLYASMAGVELPRHFILASKSLMQADGVARAIDPGFDPVRALLGILPDLMAAGVSPRLRGPLLSPVRDVWEGTVNAVASRVPFLQPGQRVPKDTAPDEQPAIVRWTEDGVAHQANTVVGKLDSYLGRGFTSIEVFEPGERYTPVPEY